MAASLRASQMPPVTKIWSPEQRSRIGLCAYHPLLGWPASPTLKVRTAADEERIRLAEQKRARKAARALTFAAELRAEAQRRAAA